MNQSSADFCRQRRIDFGQYLKGLREDREKTQTEVEGHLKIKHGRLSLIESGERPVSDQLLLDLAKEYNVPLEEILRARYRPQLYLLDGIMRPAELIRDLKEDLRPEDMEEVTRYIAFLLLKRVAVGKS